MHINSMSGYATLQRLFAGFVAMALLSTMFLSGVPSASATGSLDNFQIHLADNSPSDNNNNVVLVFDTATAITNTDQEADAYISVQFEVDGTAGTFALAASPTVTVTDDGSSLTVGTIALDDDDSDGNDDTYLIPLDLSASIAAGSEIVVTITGGKITNPNAAGSYDMSVYSVEWNGVDDYDDVDFGGSQVEIVDEISVSATVANQLSLVVAGSADDDCADDGGSGGVSQEAAAAATTVDATTIAWGTLVPRQIKSACQSLTVITNAPQGYTVYLTASEFTDGTNDIDTYQGSFTSMGAATTGFVSPTVLATDERTFGHWAFTSSPSTALSDGTKYASVTIRDYTDSSAVPTWNSGNGQFDDSWVCSSSNATSGTTCDVEFLVEISALQEAGSYSSTVQYNVVPKI